MESDYADLAETFVDVLALDHNLAFCAETEVGDILRDILSLVDWGDLLIVEFEVEVDQVLNIALPTPCLFAISDLNVTDFAYFVGFAGALRVLEQIVLELERATATYLRPLESHSGSILLFFIGLVLGMVLFGILCFRAREQMIKNLLLLLLILPSCILPISISMYHFFLLYLLLLQ